MWLNLVIFFKTFCDVEFELKIVRAVCNGITSEVKLGGLLDLLPDLYLMVRFER